MRVGVATVYTPGIFGGAEFHAENLIDAIRDAGHMVHRIALPFQYDPPEASGRALELCEKVDFSRYGGGQIDTLICLKFPSYVIGHPNKRVWLLHQHRAAYDLYDTIFGWKRGRATTDAVRKRIIAADNKALGALPTVFTNAGRVSERLKRYNDIDSTPLYHPPPDAGIISSKPALPYIFVPSRLEVLKRQDLLLKALARTKQPIQAIFAGAGSMQRQFEELAKGLELMDRVKFLGAIPRAEMLELYANAAAVFFGPVDEDYGYITLEAMLAHKPVITCTDSGGPLEFVIDGETGVISEPQPADLADALDRLMADPARAAEMGENGYQRYRALDISWNNVVETLLAPQPALATAAGAP
ncbi:glycosyl transferase family 1 [Devosia pacifica]|uniref:Glycosyl transferase family 1 n=1 Tax=Devosia pacifica TaxID=1335967 RepID=A0A918SCS0_9HYPH|nr:glycosyltransferase family 4 protein [Devosia pacifica]GHA32612.1 glycosyl transferase family 1 [Devosia pacifica]